MTKLHIIYTATAMLLSKERFASWRDIQDRHDDYKASLGPWTQEAVVDYLENEYTDLHPDAATQVHALLDSDSATCTLTFR